jgi:hypothetical protein
VQNINTPFFILLWGRCGSHKRRLGTCYAKLMFLHPARSIGQIACFGASVVQNINTLFLMLGWACAGSTRSVPGHVTPNLCFCILCDLEVMQCVPGHPGHKMLTYYFSCSGWPDVGPTRNPGTRYVELVFLHSVRSGGHVARSGAPGMRKVNTLFFILGWARYVS